MFTFIKLKCTFPESGVYLLNESAYLLNESVYLLNENMDSF